VSAVLDQLQNEAGKRGEPLAQVVRQHLLEGALRRVGRLPNGGGFVLRGGMLTRAWVAPWPRPTRDLDLVGDFPFGVEETAQRFAPALTEILDDGVIVDPARFAAQGIWTDTSFPGVRLSLWLGLGEADQPLCVDVGFGDPLVPEPVWLDYPALLPEPRVRIRACRPETQAAWKLHGLAEMGASWRPKDLVDLWLILTRIGLAADALPPAIEAAFVSRGYRVADAAELFERPHWSTKTARVRWGAQNRGRLPELPQVLAEVRQGLAPALVVLAAR
jgi:Nucleotidyl transferase AbiEii toxin, Type IV TA system